jgi:hypothetical protein
MGRGERDAGREQHGAPGANEPGRATATQAGPTPDFQTSPARSEATQRVAAFLGDVAAAGESADTIADAAARSLAGVSKAVLPIAAHAAWNEIARLLKASSDKPIEEPAIAAMRSWPTRRLASLLGKIRELHDILQRIDNDRWEDDIRDKLRHSYL